MKPNLIERIKRRFRRPAELGSPAEPETDFAAASYEERIRILQDYFAFCDDMKFVPLPEMGGKEVGCLVYLDSLVYEREIDSSLIRTMLQYSKEGSTHNLSQGLQSLDEAGIMSAGFASRTGLSEIVNAILSGHAIILGHSIREVYSFPTLKETERQPGKVESETSIRGRKMGFVEDIDTNIELIRQSIKTGRLKVRYLTVGEYSRTKVGLMYIADLAPADVVESIREKISQIQIDAILGSNYVAEMIIPRAFSPFPQVLVSERTDRILGSILEGRIAIIVDGDPGVLILPVTFPQLFMVIDDYLSTPLVATALRFMRYFAFFIATTGTAAYVGFTNFHYEVIPFRMLVLFASSIAAIPLSPLMEALLLETVAELLRESSNRLPGAMGPMVGILGAVLLGQAAITASLVSPILVIFVAMSLVSSFVIPSYELSQAVRIIKYPMIILAGFL